MVNKTNSSHEMTQTASDDDKNFTHITQYLKDAQPSHKRSIPPLEQWQPKHCGKMDLTIKANGEWWHEGQLIKRQALLDLFASVLYKEDEHFYLKTPVEQIEIEVEDEPLLVNQVDRVTIEDKTYLQLTTTNQDLIIVDEAHPVFMREYQAELRPYVYVRYGCNALIQRAAYYHLIELGKFEQNAAGETVLSLTSGDFSLQLSH